MRWAIAAWASRTGAFDSTNFLPPLRPGGLEPGYGAFADQLPLHLGEEPEQGDHRLGLHVLDPFEADVFLDSLDGREADLPRQIRDARFLEADRRETALRRGRHNRLGFAYPVAFVRSLGRWKNVILYGEIKIDPATIKMRAP